MTYDEFWEICPEARYVVCRHCHRQHAFFKATAVVAIMGYVDTCPDCEGRLRDCYNHFLWWLTDGRPQGKFDAVGALAEAVKRDANGITLSTYEETREYLRARGFCVDALDLAWVEWQQYRKEQTE